MLELTAEMFVIKFNPPIEEIDINNTDIAKINIYMEKYARTPLETAGSRVLPSNFIFKTDLGDTVFLISLSGFY